MAGRAAWSPARPAVLLLGDSLTQEGTASPAGPGGWAERLAALYSRRADVVNRGMSGYNTRWARRGLDYMWAPHRATELATVWFGANDAADAALNPRQHVSVDEFKRNLAEIVSRVQRRCDKVVVISAPPIHEPSFRTLFVEPRAGKGAPIDRTLEASGRYAAAAGEVAASAGCAFLDLWAKVQAAAPSGGGDLPWGKFFYDGLHFSAEGHRLVFESLVALIEERFPQLAVRKDPVTHKMDNSASRCEGLPPHLPMHDEITLENQETILEGGGDSAKRVREA